MKKWLLNRFDGSTLKELADKFSKEYYHDIDKLSASIQRYTENIPEIPDMSVLAFKKEARLAGDKLRQHIVLRGQVLLPYLHELFHKKDTGHNCGNCSANCSIEHTLKITELRSSITDIKNITGHISDELSKIKNTEHDIRLALLCNDIKLVCSLATELVVLEEEILLPGIIEAQKEINAYN